LKRLILIEIYIDEILVNAADNYQNDKTQNMIQVTIDPERNTIKVWNNGRGIPVQIHKVYNCYVPDMIFGKLTLFITFDRATIDFSKLQRSKEEGDRRQERPGSQAH